MNERTRSSVRRRRRQYAPLAIAIAAGGAAVACAPDSAGAPTAPPAAAPAPRALLGLDPLLTTTTTLVTSTVTTLDNTVSGLLGLLGTCSQQDQLKAGKYIGIYGGSITVGDHKLVVPAGALSQTVYITATQQSGTVVEIDFQPHGLKFAKPATLTLDYGTCSTAPGSAQSIVYVNDSNQIVELRPSTDNTSSDVVTAPINHFSGYAVATGRTGE